MVIIKKDGREEIVTHRNSLFLITGILAAFILVMMLFKMIGDDAFANTDNLRDIVITIFSIFAVAAISFLGFFNYFKTVVIDESGISSHFLLMHRHMPWHEVVEYGAYQSNNGVRTSQSSVLYFARKPQLDQRRGRKKLSVDTVRAHLVSDAEYAAIRDKVIGYAKGFTTVEPYLGSDAK